MHRSHHGMHNSENNNSSHEDNMLKVNHKYDILNSCHEWEQKLLPIYERYQKTRHMCDLELSKLDINFYL
ncbi:MAG: hypothetical protein Q8811_02620, partial [Candidatus Phytoplasma australasiaticum]|nr:hypothetical protein [Candidatus Phytoplasma australasiaticum]